MPFFSAVPTSYPLDTEVDKGLVSAGPYIVQEWNKKTSALAVRNPQWKNNQEPWKSLGLQNNVDRITCAGIGGDLATHRLQCENNEADICGFPTAQAKELADKYGVNKGRFMVDQDLLVWRVDLNNDQPLFKDNPKLRQAVLNALDRRFMTAQHGYLAGKRTDQFLPYGMAGLQGAEHLLAQGPELRQGEDSSRRATPAGGKAVFYAFNRAQGPPVAQSVQFNLKQIGIDVEIKLYDRVVQNTKAATRASPSTSRTRVGTPTIRIRRTSSTCCSTAAGSRRRTTSTRRTSRATASRTTTRSSTPRSRRRARSASTCMPRSTATSWLNGAPTGDVHLRHDAPLLQRRYRVLRRERAGGHRAHHDLQEVTPCSTGAGGAHGPPAPPFVTGSKRSRLRPMFQLSRPTAAVVARAVPRGHDRHLRHLLPRPRQPRAARGRPVGIAREGRRGRGVPRPERARLRPVLRASSSAWSSRARWGTRSSTARRSTTRSSAPRRSRPRSSSARCCSCSSIAIPIGVLSALQPRSLLDRAAMTYVLIGISLPSFWIALVLSYIVGYKLGWTPIAGYCEVFSVPEASNCGGVVDWAYHMILPWTALAIVTAGVYVRFVRAEVMETMNAGLRAHGARQGRARAHGDEGPHPAERPPARRDDPRHGHRHPPRRRDLHRDRLRPERASAPPRSGRSASSTCPTLQGVVIFGALAIIIFTLIVDLLYAWIDPRIRLT